jgi:uncharacterized protein YlbG (UPF0298 family)
LKRKPKFKPGTVVVFDPASFNPDFWKKLSEEDRLRYYGELGYGSNKLKFFVFLCEVNESGHCVLIDMDSNKILTMRHISDFRAATEEEF